MNEVREMTIEQTLPASADQGYDELTGVSDRLGPEVCALHLPPPFPPHRVPAGARPTEIPDQYFPRLSPADRTLFAVLSHRHERLFLRRPRCAKRSPGV